MKRILIILSFTLGLTTAAQANKLWECSVPAYEDDIGAQLIRFEDRVVEMWDDGAVYIYECNTDEITDDDVKKEICIRRDDNFLQLAIFDEVGRVPSTYTFFEVLFEKKINVLQPFTIKLFDCKEY